METVKELEVMTPWHLNGAKAGQVIPIRIVTSYISAAGDDNLNTLYQTSQLGARVNLETPS